MQRVAAGVRVLPVRTPTLLPATHTNVWLVGERRVTVVDPASPYPEEQQRLVDALADEGLEVERIALTHHHPDHVGGAEALEAALRARGAGVPIWAHRWTAERLPGLVGAGGDLGDGATLTCDGVELRAWHTPGHAPGHLIFQAGELAIAGDMVAGIGTILIDPVDGDLQDYLDSLERMRRLGIVRLGPAHGPILEQADAVLSMYIAHRHMRSAQVREAIVRVGTASIEQLVPLVYPDLPPAVHPVAAVQLLAHLRWLLGQGLVQMEGSRWRISL